MATSRAALPVMSIYTCVLWLALLAMEHTLWPVFLVFVLNIYLMIELNNRNALMHQYSRMVSCSYIAMMLMSPWLFSQWEITAVQMCFIMTLRLLFQTYQKREMLGNKYWAYLFFGIAAVIWPPMLYLLPILWIAESAFLMSFSWKALWASIFGVITPLWFAAPAVVYYQMYDSLREHYMQLLPGERINNAFNDPMLLLPQEMPLSLLQTSVIAFILLLIVTGLVHYMRNSYSEKIHVRMLYHFFMMLVVIMLLAMITTMVLPFENKMSVDILYAMLIVCGSPLLAHYIAFTYTRLTNISVVIILLAVLGITAYQFAEMMIEIPQIINTIDLQSLHL